MTDVRTVLQAAAEAIDDAKEAAKSLIQTLGQRIAELVANNDTEALAQLAAAIQADADELAGFVVANTPAAPAPVEPDPIHVEDEAEDEVDDDSDLDDE